MKRATVSFDTKHFEKKKNTGLELSTEETFIEIFRSNHWAGNESISGRGSSRQQTDEISRQIPLVVRALKVRRFLDLPCGDFNWLSKIDLEIDLYIGGDIISDIIEKNNQNHKRKNRKFLKIDLIKDRLPEADLLHCRDCLVHFSNEDIQSAIENIKRSGIKYLLTTTFSDCERNPDIVTGDWRIINLEKEPFNFPKPMKLINEKCTEGGGTYSDKCLGLWEISKL